MFKREGDGRRVQWRWDRADEGKGRAVGEATDAHSLAEKRSSWDECVSRGAGTVLAPNLNWTVV